MIKFLVDNLSQRPPEQQAKILLVNLPNLLNDLQKGCVIVIEENRIRIRSLPIGGN